MKKFRLMLLILLFFPLLFSEVKQDSILVSNQFIIDIYKNFICKGAFKWNMDILI